MHKSARIYLAIPLLFGGVILQGLANETFDTFLVGVSFLLLGLLLVILLSKRQVEEVYTFIFVYALCLFAGGLAQNYSLLFFDDIQATNDAAVAYFPYIQAQPPFATWENMPAHNGKMAILIWQKFYQVGWYLGLDFGPYIGVMFNALIMGLAASLTVGTARILYGPDTAKLRLVATLISLNALLIASGAVLVREGLVTIFFVLSLWASIRFLLKTNFFNFIIFLSIIALSAYVLTFLRLQSSFFIYTLATLVLLVCLLRGSSRVFKLITFSSLTTVFLIFFSDILNIFLLLIELQSYEQDKYLAFGFGEAAADSLGMMLMELPIAVRIPVGSLILLMNPIPFWSYFSVLTNDYNWFLGYQAVYIFFFMPVLITAVITIFNKMTRDMRGSYPFILILVFFTLGLFSISITSMDVRHLTQFMPALMVLSALPNFKEEKIRKLYKNTLVLWSLFFLSVHSAWFVLKI